jgi:MoxR-like ATPase
MEPIQTQPIQAPRFPSPPETNALSPVLRLQEYLNQRVLGQPVLVDRLIVALLADGHLLVEGAPGLAKTTAVKALADGIVAEHHRIQFTPDLLPADLTGSDVYHAEDGSFRFQPGPVFHNLVLADEINRAPAKVQSALLEAMAEGQVTVGRKTYPLPELFLVMATQNPIEQEGTYPLPEAQLDRFLMYVKVDYPDAAVERKVLHLAREQSRRRAVSSFEPLTQDEIFRARDEVQGVHVAPALEEYLAQLVLATRDASPYSEEIARWIAWGASPRGTIALDRCTRAHAWLNGRSYATPDDVHAVAEDVLRHRVLINYEAQSEGMTSEDVVGTLIALVPLP